MHVLLDLTGPSILRQRRRLFMLGCTLPAKLLPWIWAPLRLHIPGVPDRVLNG